MLRSSISPRRTTAKSEIRRILNRDRDWPLYALASLDERMFEPCDWLVFGDSLNRKPGHLQAARGIFAVRACHRMHRVILEDFVPRDGATVRLTAAKLEEIARGRRQHRCDPRL
jgi:hypothetical protein